MNTSLEDRELVVLGVALIALIYAGVVVKRAPRLPYATYLIGALASLAFGMFATNLESFFTGTAAAAWNFLEHLSYAVHTLLLVTYLHLSRKLA